MNVWKPIPDWPGYEVSTDGQVTKVTGSVRKRLQPYLDKRSGSYFKIKLYKEGERRTFTVARCIALAFLGEPPEGSPDASHINGNPADDRLNNIAWEPKRINNRRIWLHGRRS